MGNVKPQLAPIVPELKEEVLIFLRYCYGLFYFYVVLVLSCIIIITCASLYKIILC